jgi:hypothetical protein
MSNPLRRLAHVISVLLLVGLIDVPAPSAHADTILFKDGFRLQGQVTRQNRTLVDPVSHELIPLQEGFFLLDDGPRRIIFSPTQLLKVDDKAPAPAPDVISSERLYLFPGAPAVPAVGEPVKVGPWNDKWDRDYSFHVINGGNLSIGQHIAFLTPRYLRIDATKRFNWRAFYLTSEFGSETVSQLISLHPDFKDNKDATEAERAERRFRIHQFYVYAGWFAEAEAELSAIEKDLPGQKGRVETERATLKKLRSVQRLEKMRLAQLAGQHEEVRRLLAQFPEEGIDEQVLLEFRALKSGYETAAQNLQLAQRHLEELARAKTVPPLSQELLDASAAIRAEVHLEDFLKVRESDPTGRLEIFLAQARQAERQRHDGRTPDLDAAQLLSLAVTGWLLGSSSAEAKSDVAQALWRARQFVLRYQRTKNRGDRIDLLKDYTKSGPIGADEMAQLISRLLPVEAEEKISTAVVETVTRLPDSRDRTPISYYLQLPPEYHHSRPFPVLIVLHEESGDAREMLSRWKDLAAQHGYILAAPQWQKGFQQDYTFTTQEHRVVLDVLADLRRRYQVDSDRVFLSGTGQGGDMAYDIGLSHPDQFAGVVPMGGAPYRFAQKYWRNGQFLPFYSVGGDHAGDVQKQSIAQFQEWIGHAYPMIYVQYRGRGAEWFAGELPTVFDWMDRKTRANPTTQLGRSGNGGAMGDEFRSMRAADDRFYWVGLDEVDGKYLNEGPKFKGGIEGATMCAWIKDNQINVKTSGVKQLSIWLTKDMLDFAKPVFVVVNSAAAQRFAVRANLEVLFDDFFERGDRQRLYVAKIAVKGDKER